MSALNFNKIIMCGRLTADPELRVTQGGQSVLSFTLAVNRPKIKGVVEQKADFFKCVAWDKLAEFISLYFRKGDSLFIIGKLTTRTYQSKDGRTMYITETVAHEAHFVDNKTAGEEPPALDDPPQFEEITDDQLPF